jgi:hypothetical protein
MQHISMFLIVGLVVHGIGHAAESDQREVVGN